MSVGLLVRGNWSKLVLGLAIPVLMLGVTILSWSPAGVVSVFAAFGDSANAPSTFRISKYEYFFGPGCGTETPAGDSRGEGGVRKTTRLLLHVRLKRSVQRMFTAQPVGVNSG